MRKYILLPVIVLIMLAPSASFAEVWKSSDLQARHFNQTERQSENYRVWCKLAHASLAACHRGELHFNAGVLAKAIKQCELSDICPGLSLPEIYKYLAKDSYFQCKLGDFSGNAANLQFCILELRVPINKIDRKFTQSDLTGFLAQSKPKTVKTADIQTVSRMSTRDVEDFLIAFALPIYFVIRVFVKYGLNRKERRHALVLLRDSIRSWADHKAHNTNWPTRPVYVKLYQKLEYLHF